MDYRLIALNAQPQLPLVDIVAYSIVKGKRRKSPQKYFSIEPFTSPVFLSNLLIDPFVLHKARHEFSIEENQSSRLSSTSSRSTLSEYMDIERGLRRYVFGEVAGDILRLVYDYGFKPIREKYEIANTAVLF